MANSSEVEALKASFRGALSTAGALQSLQSKIESLDATGEVTSEMLEELARVTAAHALASAALRGLVETMIARRQHAASAGALAEADDTTSTTPD